MRLREPKATALIFGSGKLVITGTKSCHNSSLATKKIAYILERIGFRPNDHINFKVQNIVGTVDCGFPIRLEGVAFAHPTYTSYEPELFPGLIYRLVQPKVVLLVFVSGKVVITGAKTEESLVEGLKRVFPMLLEFRKVHVAGLPGRRPRHQQQLTKWRARVYYPAVPTSRVCLRWIQQRRRRRPRRPCRERERGAVLVGGGRRHPVQGGGKTCKMLENDIYVVLDINLYAKNEDNSSVTISEDDKMIA